VDEDRLLLSPYLHQQNTAAIGKKSGNNSSTSKPKNFSSRTEERSLAERVSQVRSPSEKTDYAEGLPRLRGEMPSGKGRTREGGDQKAGRGRSGPQFALSERHHRGTGRTESKKTEGGKQKKKKKKTRGGRGQALKNEGTKEERQDVRCSSTTSCDNGERMISDFERPSERGEEREVVREGKAKGKSLALA